MNSYFLGVEAVNLDNFVYDTNDLSTIRGGGLLLLKAPLFVKEGITGLEQISLGASSGLFSFKATDDCAAAEVAKDVRNILAKDKNYKHATFVVNVVRNTGEYRKDKEKLLALGRWQQMTTLSLAFPSESDSVEGRSPVCEFDYVRPAAGDPVQKGDKFFAVSPSVRARMEYGQENKKKSWYDERTQFKEQAGDELPEFVSDLQGLTGGDQATGIPEKLQGKMAVIYLDGNGFGVKRRAFCENEEKEKEFDRKIRIEFQNGTLYTLLHEIYKDPAWLTAEGKLRLETLLWGGDEILWVVPAWKGWWMLKRFFEIVGEKWLLDGSPLTLAGGLVFCNHKAPIQRIVSLARQLGDLAKGKRDRNLFAYQILESFDHAGLDLEDFRKKRLPPSLSLFPEKMLIEGRDMCCMEKDFRFLKQYLPKRQLYRFALSLCQQKETEDFTRKRKEEIGKILEKNLPEKSTLTKEEYSPDRKDLQEKDLSYWLHLVELWDYVGMEGDEKGGKSDVSY